ncbi:Acetyltransferase ataH [Colletotrichum gloeosporioides]|uniref:Acetyltransferase ataH n=1 Tax=Colletotrichum gloeosporioides TaxID=474922 RepID=A0A8H4CFL0_COLGL|nr:Acetyltransferase ataH [Colletotrichum gloeosporioides]KAF3802854.1 Acetyltransferase ataH [Colletotrichum gloeosporioides]
MLFVASATLTTFTLHLPPQFHSWLFLPAWLLTALSLASVKEEMTPRGPVALNSYTVITCFIFMLNLPTILLFENHSFEPRPDQETGQRDRASLLPWPTRRSVAAACRIWNNPRNLQFRKSGPASASWNALIRFLFRRGSRVAVGFLVDRLVVQRIQGHLSAASNLLDFTPDQQQIIRPIFSHLFLDGIESPYRPISSHRLALRAFMSVSWIWTNFLVLEFYHLVLAIIFVIILRLDDPEDWPPLFGSISDAWTLQRFWGRFWHRVATPTLTTWTRFLLQGAKTRALGKVLQAFGVFLLSGLMHATASWRTGQHFEHLDVWFFCVNFVAVGAEITAIKSLSWGLRDTKIALLVEKSWPMRMMSKAFGFTWVFAWFFWSVPRWLYPKTMRWAIKQALIQSYAS